MNKANVSKSMYTTSAPGAISRELKKEFKLRYVEIFEDISTFQDFRLVTVNCECYKKDKYDILNFLRRFDAEERAF